MLDPIWLRSFIAVAESLSFTEAAQRLEIRQSTVSEHVRKLEAACGRRLLLRDTHSVAVSVDGEAMLGFARSILDANVRAMRHFAEEDLHGRVRLGISEDVVLTTLTDALRAFVKAHPRVELELTVGVSETLRNRFEAGKLDLVFLKRRTGETHGDLVWRDPLVWAAAEDFRIDPDCPLPLVLLAPPALTRSIALAALEKQGRRWTIICSSDSQSGVHAAVIAGLGIAPHARSLLPPGLHVLQDRRLPALGETEFILLSRRGDQDNSLRALSAVLMDGRKLQQRYWP